MIRHCRASSPQELRYTLSSSSITILILFRCPFLQTQRRAQIVFLPPAPARSKRAAPARSKCAAPARSPRAAPARSTRAAPAPRILRRRRRHRGHPQGSPPGMKWRMIRTNLSSQRIPRREDTRPGRRFYVLNKHFNCIFGIFCT